MRRGNPKNAFVKHLKMSHPYEEREPEIFKFDVLRTFSKNLDRQIAEAVHIYRSKADIVVNSKSEFMQPAMERVIVTRGLTKTFRRTL